MGRVNKFTEGVFTDIVGTQTRTSKFEQFINLQDTMKKPKGDLKKFLDEYKSTTEENKPIFEKLSLLEDAIMQIRTKENITSEHIKLNTVREYIYARTTFHRKDTTTDDIRVIVGQTDEYGTNTDVLYDNKKFMELAKEKLISSMEEVIQQTLKKIK